jgi:hypothetical protein
MTYTTGQWHQENPGWVFESASIVSIDHEKSELTLMDARPKVPTVQAVLDAYKALYDHDATLYVSIGEDGKLCVALGWWEVCTEDCSHCREEIDADDAEVIFEAASETLDEALADLAAQLREQAQLTSERFDKALGLLATE